METLTAIGYPQQSQRVASQIVSVVGGSLFIALAAQISIPLFFSPVPLTLHTLALFLIARSMPKKTAVLAVITYLAEGAAGLPVFAGGAAGPQVFLGPTGGYLAGFVVAMFLMGLVFERARFQSTFVRMATFALGSAAVYGCGAVYLAHFIGFSKALLVGVLPFLPGDLLKAAFAAKATGRFFGARSHL